MGLFDNNKGLIESQKDKAINEQLNQDEEDEEDRRVSRRRVVSQDKQGVGNVKNKKVFSPSERKTIIDTGGILSDKQRKKVGNLSERFRGGVGKVADKAGDLGSKLSPPALINRGIDASPFLPDADKEGASKFGRKSTEGFVKGGGSVLNAPAFVKSVDTGARIADDADKLAKNPRKTAGTTALIGGAVASNALESARENPSGAFGSIAGAAGVGTAVTPLRVNRFKVPKKSGSDTSVTGIDVQTPPIVNRFKSGPPSRKTVAGLEGKKPTTGTPQIRNLDDVDVERLGGDKANQGEVFEPIRGFESDVVSKSVLNQGREDDVARISSGLGLLDEAETLGDIRKRRVSREDAVETIRRADEVESDPESVARGLDRADATIFGSGAVDAQASEGFRRPGDIDIVVPDKDKAGKAIAEETGLTKEQAKNRFDVKEADDFAGLEGGEQFGFGRFSRQPVDAGGIRINPIGEELQRKTGASLFLRGESIGKDRLDVGPRPVRDPDTPIRRKDPVDAFKIGEELGADSAEDFARAFDITEDEIRDRGFAGSSVIQSDSDSASSINDFDTDLSVSEASRVFDTSSPTVARGDSVGSFSSLTAQSSPSISRQADSLSFDSITSQPSSVVSESPSVSSRFRESPSVSSPIRDSPSIGSIGFESSTPTSSTTSSPQSPIFDSPDSIISEPPSSSTPPTSSSPSPETSITPPSFVSQPPSSSTPPSFSSTPPSFSSTPPSSQPPSSQPPGQTVPPRDPTNPTRPRKEEDEDEDEREILDFFRTQSLTFEQELASLDDILGQDDFF